MEITKINFGTAYYRGVHFGFDWNGGGTDYKSFDLNFIGTSYADFSTFCDSIMEERVILKWGELFCGLNSIFMLMIHLSQPHQQLTLPFQQVPDTTSDLKLSDTSIGGGNHYLDYVISRGSITIHYPTCTATAVTGEGVSGSTVPFGGRNAEELKGDV